MRQYERCPRCGATDLYTQEASGCWGARVICSNCRLQIPKASNMMMLGGAIHEEEQSMDRTGRYPWEDHVFRHTVQVLQGTWDGRGLVRDAKGDLQSLRGFASQVEEQAYGYPSDKPIKIHVAAHVCDMPACSAEKAAEKLLEQLWDAVRQTEDAAQRSVIHGVRRDIQSLEFDLLRIRRCLKELMPLLVSALALTGAIPWPYEHERRQATFGMRADELDEVKSREDLMRRHVPPDLRPIWAMPMPETMIRVVSKATADMSEEEQLIAEERVDLCRLAEKKDIAQLEAQEHKEKEQVRHLMDGTCRGDAIRDIGKRHRALRERLHEQHAQRYRNEVESAKERKGPDKEQ